MLFFHGLHLLWFVNDKNSRGKQFKGRQKNYVFDEFLWLNFSSFFETMRKLKENEESVNVCEAEKEESDSLSSQGVEIETIFPSDLLTFFFESFKQFDKN